PTIRALSPILPRRPDTVDARPSLIPLPNPYVVPGGRFREVYYWDSYFTMLGLIASGRTDLMKSMLDNFAHLIRTVGHIPNGNRRIISAAASHRFLPPWSDASRRRQTPHKPCHTSTRWRRSTRSGWREQ